MSPFIWCLLDVNQCVMLRFTEWLHDQFALISVISNEHFTNLMPTPLHWLFDMIIIWALHACSIAGGGCCMLMLNNIYQIFLTNIYLGRIVFILLLIMIFTCFICRLQWRRKARQYHVYDKTDQSTYHKCLERSRVSFSW